ncbi:MAG: alpha/beta hydrolase [Planctomycetota bacterium]|jgi:fermentation-respiration switch protein FrsA (DUF1100 family)
MKVSRPMLIFIEIIAVLIIAYSALGWTLFFMQPAFLYKPVRGVLYTPDELGLDFEKVTLKTDDGLHLSSWYVPAGNSQMTVLFCHGNGGNMMHRLDSINILYNLGLNCLVFDYRGYGNSEGKPTEEGTYLDAKAAYKWLTEQKNIAPENSLIIESAFTSYVDVGRKFYPYMPVRFFARFSYKTIDYIKDVHFPVMIIHSRNDDLIPFEFGLELYETANEPKEFVEIFGGHNDGFLVSSEIYNKAWTKWLNFLQEHKSQTSTHQAS